MTPVGTVVLATLASGNPMGQQAYERELIAGIADLPAADLRVVPRAVRSLRSTLPGEVRLPMGALARLPGWGQRGLGAYAYRGASLVHRLDLRLPPAPGPEVLTILDAAWIHFADEARPLANVESTVRRAAAVIVPSSFSGEEVVEHLGVDRARVHLIPLGVDAAFSRAEPLTGRDRDGLPARFVLHSGGCSARKNLAALAGAWPAVAAAEPSVHLVLCGPEDQRRTELFAGLPRVHLLGRVAQARLERIVATAAVVVVPSLYEGFGLPVAEALAAGTPVVAARTSSLIEVADGRATLVDPDADGLAGGILLELRRESRPADRSYRSWDSCVAQHLAVYRQVLGA